MKTELVSSNWFWVDGGRMQVCGSSSYMQRVLHKQLMDFRESFELFDGDMSGEVPTVYYHRSAASTWLPLPARCPCCIHSAALILAHPAALTNTSPSIGSLVAGSHSPCAPAPSLPVDLILGAGVDRRIRRDVCHARPPRCE